MGLRLAGSCSRVRFRTQNLLVLAFRNISTCDRDKLLSFSLSTKSHWSRSRPMRIVPGCFVWLVEVKVCDRSWFPSIHSRVNLYIVTCKIDIRSRTWAYYTAERLTISLKLIKKCKHIIRFLYLPPVSFFILFTRSGFLPCSLFVIE